MFGMVVWTWESLFAFMSRERGEGGILVVHQNELRLPIEDVGRPCRNAMSSWNTAEEGPMGALHYPGSLTYQIHFDDGSYLFVEHRDAHYYITLFPAKLPQVSWLSDLAPLPWLAFPSVLAFFLLAALV